MWYVAQQTLRVSINGSTHSSSTQSAELDAVQENLKNSTVDPLQLVLWYLLRTYIKNE